MKKPLAKDIPDENTIERLFERYKPWPSGQFHKRMETAPWKRRATPRMFHILNIKLVPRLIWAFGIFLVLLSVAVALFIPNVRAIARQVIFSFLPAPSNRIEVQVTPANPDELFNYSDPANFQLSLDEAQHQAGFQVVQINPLTENLTLIGARYEPVYRSVILLYQGENVDLFLTQRMLGNGQDVFSVGQDALVKLVKIGNTQGEFVEGGWKATSIQPTTDHLTTQNPINISAIWDDRLPQSTLRWQVDRMTYELRTIGEQRPSLPDLINYAIELK